jgi:hypothetical protein
MKKRRFLYVLGVVVAVAAGAQDLSLAPNDGDIQSPNGTVQTTGSVGRAPLPDTGLTSCWDTDGNPRDCAGTREDGEFRAGVAWPTPRFTDNGDGTVADNLTGLIWLKDANCPGEEKVWQGALDWVALLNTTAIACTDYTAMTFTDWRLPNIRELTSLIDYGQPDLLPVGYPFIGVLPNPYWSSSTFRGFPQSGWSVRFDNGRVGQSHKIGSGGQSHTYSVWPVRGGLWSTVGAPKDPSLVLNDGGIQFPDGTVQMTAMVGRTPLPETGLTGCWDSDGILRPCAGTGEDGEFRAGVAWPTPRFTDNGNGTVTDNLTGLTWLRDANCPAGTKTWQEALDWVGSLNTTSVACTDYTAMTFTDWQLPNIRELTSLIDYGQGGQPMLPEGHPFLEVKVLGESYWSSSSYAPSLSSAWYQRFGLGNVASQGKVELKIVWPVRGGQ